MFQAKEVIYGFFKDISTPKNKYLIVLHRDANLLVTACFTTSQQRAGIPLGEIVHGVCKNASGEVISYVFLKGQTIGVNPTTGEPFSFPRQTTVTFDYGVHQIYYEKLSSDSFLENPKVVCVLSDAEYINLVYAMYRSPKTKGTIKSVLQSILEQQG